MAIDVEKLAERYERTGHMNPRTAIRWLRDLQSDLAAARARIAELEARLASLTSVSEEDVERAASAWVDEYANYEIIGVTGENLPFKVFSKDRVGPIALFVGPYRDCVSYIRKQAIRAALTAFVSR